MDLQVKKLERIISKQQQQQRRYGGGCCRATPSHQPMMHSNTGFLRGKNFKIGKEHVSDEELDNFISTLTDNLKNLGWYKDENELSLQNNQKVPSASLVSYNSSSEGTALSSSTSTFISSSFFDRKTFHRKNKKIIDLEDIALIHESIGIAYYYKKDYTSAFSSFTKAIWIQSSNKERPNKHSMKLNLQRIATITSHNNNNNNTKKQSSLRKSFKEVLEPTTTRRGKK